MPKMCGPAGSGTTKKRPMCGPTPGSRVWSRNIERDVRIANLAKARKAKQEKNKVNIKEGK